KLDLQAIKCHFLGYKEDSKAYRLQLKGTMKVIKSCDVVFHEDKALLKTPPNEINLLPPSSDLSEMQENDVDQDLGDQSESSTGSVGGEDANL
ncbi:hypothetical protein FRC11_011481, partial [Ceratobasidium sp. 423]